MVRKLFLGYIVILLVPLALAIVRLGRTGCPEPFLRLGWSAPASPARWS